MVAHPPDKFWPRASAPYSPGAKCASQHVYGTQHQRLALAPGKYRIGPLNSKEHKAFQWALHLISIFIIASFWYIWMGRHEGVVPKLNQDNWGTFEGEKKPPSYLSYRIVAPIRNRAWPLQVKRATNWKVGNYWPEGKKCGLLFEKEIFGFWSNVNKLCNTLLKYRTRHL